MIRANILPSTSDFSPFFKRLLEIAEPVWLAGMLLAFWYRSPTRDTWHILLLGIPIFWGLRFALYRRLWTFTPLTPWLILFVILGFLNVLVAPFRRAPNDPLFSALTLMSRPLLGIALVIYFIETARLRRSMGALVGIALGIGAVVAVLALGASQWNTKSLPFQSITSALPRIDTALAAFDIGGGFNANEIAGGLAYVTAMAAGLIAFRKNWRILAGIIFAALLLALVLGQSRFAIFGTLLALALMTPLLIRQWRWRFVAWAGIFALVLLETLLVLNIITTGNVGLNDRDESSFSTRLDIWESALFIMRDYPLTGAGLNMFRDGRVRTLYPVPTFKQPVLPHAHQEWLQIGADMGIPGVIVFAGIHAAAAYMLFITYKRGDASAKAIAVGVAGGLVAHTVFSIGDAIALWDRLSFLFWLLLGLGAAQYTLITRTSEPDLSDHLIE